jgi:hypothetical protein
MEAGYGAGSQRDGARMKYTKIHLRNQPRRLGSQGQLGSASSGVLWSANGKSDGHRLHSSWGSWDTSVPVVGLLQVPRQGSVRGLAVRSSSGLCGTCLACLRDLKLFAVFVLVLDGLSYAVSR